LLPSCQQSTAASDCPATRGRVLQMVAESSTPKHHQGDLQQGFQFPQLVFHDSPGTLLIEPTDPAPISGKAMDWKPFSAARAMAFLTESRIDRSDARQSMLIPATWMIPLNGSRPAEVSTAPPSGIGPCLANSLKGPVPPRLLIAPETPCGSRSHDGMMFRFQALTITSTS